MAHVSYLLSRRDRKIQIFADTYQECVGILKMHGFSKDTFQEQDYCTEYDHLSSSDSGENWTRIEYNDGSDVPDVNTYKLFFPQKFQNFEVTVVQPLAPDEVKETLSALKQTSTCSWYKSKIGEYFYSWSCDYIDLVISTWNAHLFGEDSVTAKTKRKYIPVVFTDTFKSIDSKI